MKEKYLKLLEGYSRLSGSLAKGCNAICYFLLVVVTLVAGMAIFTRYVLNDALTWTEELARYCLIWVTLIGSSVAIRFREHISLDMIVRRLPKRLSTTIELVMFSLIVVIMVIIVKSSWAMVFTQATMRFSPTLNISMAWIQIILPIGFFLILIQSLHVVIEDIQELLEHQTP